MENNNIYLLKDGIPQTEEGHRNWQPKKDTKDQKYYDTNFRNIKDNCHQW